jgi:hypothetical protein
VVLAPHVIADVGEPTTSSMMPVSIRNRNDEREARGETDEPGFDLRQRARIRNNVDACGTKQHGTNTNFERIGGPAGFRFASLIFQTTE